MAYKIGLDLGTASCAIVAWQLNAENKPVDLIDADLRIWSEPLLPPKQGGVGTPKKSERRKARQMRRQIDRRAQRYRSLASLSRHIGVDNYALQPDKGQRIHELRAKAARNQVELDELMLVFMKLAKRRGYSGGFKIKSDDKDAGVVESGIRELKEAMASEARDRGATEPPTLGEFLCWRSQAGKTLKLKQDGLYADRDIVETEFDQIWNTQAQYHDVLSSRVDGKPLKELFQHAIFYQRPLKSPSPMVGRCSLEPTLPRAPWAQMAAQQFRIEKQIADLRWGMGRNAVGLTDEEKDVIRDLLVKQATVPFKTIIKALEDADLAPLTGRGLNMDRVGRDELKGNSTLATFRKLKLEDEWLALDEVTQVQVINFLADLGSPDALNPDDWHQRFFKNARKVQNSSLEPRRFAPAMVEFINLLRNHEKFDRLTKMGFAPGRASYSIKALNKLVPLMQEGWDEYSAIEQAYPEHNAQDARSGELLPPPETGNVVVDVAMRQIHRAIRELIQRMGEAPSQIVVELSRDMALGLARRGEIEKRIARNQSARKKAAVEIENHDVTPNDRNIYRYQLWESQQHYCPYCGDRMSLSEAMDGGRTESDHILPRSLTQVGGKRSQLVLAHRRCNQDKAGRTPLQAFGHDEDRWSKVKFVAGVLHEKKQWGKAKLLLLTDWENEVLDNQAIKDFSDRQFHESSWISKLSARWLRDICEDVSVSRGGLTAHLRRIWKLGTVIPQARIETGLPIMDRDNEEISPEEFERHKSWWEGHGKSDGAEPTDRQIEKRIDHRHHLIDALVISLVDRGLYQRMARNYKAESEKAARGEPAKLSLFEEPPVTGIRNRALEMIREAVPKHKPDRYPDGALFKQTAYGISREADENGARKLALKVSLDDWAMEKPPLAKARKQIESIESDLTRRAVSVAFEQRVAEGAEPAEALRQPIRHPVNGTNITRVRVLGDSEETAATIVHTDRHGVKHEKRYVHAGNAYLEIKVQDDKVIGAPVLTTVQDAMATKGLKPPEGVRRFWKGDTVLDSSNDKKYLVRQIKAKGGGKLILTLVTETRPVKDLSKQSGLIEVQGKSLSRFTVVDDN